MQSSETPGLAVTPPALVPSIWNQLAAPSGLEPWNTFPASHVDDALRRLCVLDAESLQVGLRVYVARRARTSPGGGMPLRYCRLETPPSDPGIADPDQRSPLGWASFMERLRA